jgi:hypothetical protein
MGKAVKLSDESIEFLKTINLIPNRAVLILKDRISRTNKEIKEEVFNDLEAEFASRVQILEKKVKEMEDFIENKSSSY